MTAFSNFVGKSEIRFFKAGFLRMRVIENHYCLRMNVLYLIYRVHHKTYGKEIGIFDTFVDGKGAGITRYDKSIELLIAFLFVEHTNLDCKI